MQNNRIPLNGTFELTGRCNMQCSMCYVRVDHQAIQSSGKRERTAAEWIRMAEQAADAGTLTLLLTGGEVTLRPDFCEIYEAIAQMGFVTTVYTNATNVTDKLMDLFQKYPPHTVGVTMYGASPETYQAVCGHASGYDRFCSGLSKLKTLPSRMEIRTTLVKSNLADYEAMKEFTEREFGPDQILRVSARIYNSIRGSICNPCLERLSAQENCDFFYRWMKNLNSLIDEGKLKAEEVLNLPKLLETERDLKRRSLGPDGGYLFGNCGAGIKEYTISWAGEMYACGMCAAGCTHPFEEGFASAWERLPEQYPRTKIPEKCRSCDLQPYCESCPAYRMAETGSWDGIPEYACESAEYMQTLLEPLFRKAKR